MTFIYLITSIVPIICILGCILIYIKKNEIISVGNADKSWSMFSWLAGIFVAGMGVALICNIPSDIAGYLKSGYSPVESIFLISSYNGIPVWSLYSFLGYWYINHMDSKVGKVAAMLSTVLGMSVSLWTGSTAICRMSGISDSVILGFNFLISGIIVAIAILSAYNGWLKKVSRLAIYSFLLSFIMLIFTSKDVIGVFPKINGSLTSAAFIEYFTGNTAAFWWAWWILWAPTVARWLAHISNGKSYRQYILATTLLPSVICTLWTIVSYKYASIISTLRLTDIHSMLPAVMFIFTGMIFMSGTLDSDCKVFSEDLSSIVNGKIKQKSVMPYYAALVLILTGLYNSGIIASAYSTNFIACSSLIFIPLIGWGLADIIKSK